MLTPLLPAKPARQLPRLIVSLLELGAPVPPPGLAARLQQAQLYALERPLTIELVERLIMWLVPVRERAAAVGTGRRQVLVIAAFLVLMGAYSAFAEYWAILGDQDEFFDDGQAEGITRDSFSYLTEEAYSVGQSTRDVAEAGPFLPENVTTSTHRVVTLVLSGLRYDAFEQAGVDGTPGPMGDFVQALGTYGLLCRVSAEIPTLSVPNWIGMLMGVKPEVHGLLGNRGPAEQSYSSIFSVARQLRIPVRGKMSSLNIACTHTPVSPHPSCDLTAASLPSHWALALLARVALHGRRRSSARRGWWIWCAPTSSRSSQTARLHRRGSSSRRTRSRQTPTIDGGRRPSSWLSTRRLD